MRIAIYVVVSLVAAVGVIAIIGYFLPVNHEASRSADIAAPPERVFALLADPSTYKTWWDGADVKTAVVESAPPARVVTKIVDETQFGGTWTMEIVPTPAGSRVTITERGEVYNPVFRALARFVFGYTSTMDQCLAAARKKLQA